VQLVEQGLSFLQIKRLEAFSEPAQAGTIRRSRRTLIAMALFRSMNEMANRTAACSRTRLGKFTCQKAGR
jgi:hypothetical protein